MPGVLLRVKDIYRTSYVRCLWALANTQSGDPQEEPEGGQRAINITIFEVSRSFDVEAHLLAHHLPALPGLVGVAVQGTPATSADWASVVLEAYPVLPQLRAGTFVLALLEKFPGHRPLIFSLCKQRPAALDKRVDKGHSQNSDIRRNRFCFPCLASSPAPFEEF